MRSGACCSTTALSNLITAVGFPRRPGLCSLGRRLWPPCKNATAGLAAPVSRSARLGNGQAGLAPAPACQATGRQPDFGELPSTCSARDELGRVGPDFGELSRAELVEGSRAVPVPLSDVVSSFMDSLSLPVPLV